VFYVVLAPRYKWTSEPLGCRKFRLRDYNEIEVRDYEPYVIAEAKVTGTMRKGMRSGFMTVAKYAAAPAA
jgi:hypothetical protein